MVKKKVKKKVSKKTKKESKKKKIVKKKSKTVSKPKNKINLVNVLKENPEGLSMFEMISKTGLSEKQIKRQLDELKKKGVIGEKNVGVKKDFKKINMKEISNEIKREISDKKTGISNKKIEKKPTPEEASKKPVEDRSKFDVAAIAREIKGEIQKQRKPVVDSVEDKNFKPKITQRFKGSEKEYIFTGVPGFDELLEKGIPKGNQLLVAGGAGSGKTIFCLQTLVNKAKEGKRCLIMSLEENEDKLIRHMEDFGWDAKSLIKKGNLKLMRINPFDITRNVDALLAKQKGELLIEVNPVILPDDFKKPDFIVIDSLTAIASAFTGKDESYRIYIEQLFRFLEKTGSTGFLITETEQIPKIFSPTGVEEFLADGVIVLYNIKHGNVRENALELLKLRGAAHQKKIVAMQITGEGIIVYPEQEVFSDIE